MLDVRSVVCMYSLPTPMDHTVGIVWFFLDCIGGLVDNKREYDTDRTVILLLSTA